MVTHFPLGRPSAWPPARETDGKVSMACKANSTRLWRQPFLGAWQDEQSTNTPSGSYTSHLGVTIRWTGPLDWTSGLDYWTDLCETKQETAPIIT